MFTLETTRCDYCHQEFSPLPPVFCDDHQSIFCSEKCKSKHEDETH